MKQLSKEEMKTLMGGLVAPPEDGGTSCSASCPSGQSASITDCNGTCTGYTGYAECVGAHNTLKKNCA